MPAAAAMSATVVRRDAGKGSPFGAAEAPWKRFYAKVAERGRLNALLNTTKISRVGNRIRRPGATGGRTETPWLTW
jgi:hypothetical protein